MLEVLYNVLPVFLVVGLGYAAVVSKHISADIADNLNKLAVQLAVPILLFKSMYQLDLGQALNWPIIISFYTGAFASFTLGLLAARIIYKRTPGESVAVGFCATFSNSVLLGIPIIERTMGAEALPLILGIVALHAPSIYTVGIVVMELSRRDGRNMTETLGIAAKSIFGNPLMIAIIAGIAFNLIQIPLPDPLMVSIEMVAQAAIPLALIGIGAAMTQYELRSRLSEAFTVSFLSLIIHPAIVFCLTYFLLGLDLIYVQVAVITASMPPGMNIYIFAVMYQRAIALSASSLVLATIASIVTISSWLWIFTHLPA